MTFQDWISVIEAICSVLGASFTTYTFLSVILTKKEKDELKHSANNGVPHSGAGSGRDGPSSSPPAH